MVTEDFYWAIAEREHRLMHVAVDALPANEVSVNRARAEPLNVGRHCSSWSHALRLDPKVLQNIKHTLNIQHTGYLNGESKEQIRV